jgi:CRP-like cAMP-binding protein
MYILLSGCVGIYVGDDDRIGHVCVGECVGEVALLTGTNHSANAVAEGTVEVAVMTENDLKRLVRLRPDIGVLLYQNVARDLGSKLRRADRSRARVDVETLSPPVPHTRSTI